MNKEANSPINSDKSRQLKYYYRNRDKINHIRRKKYKINKIANKSEKGHKMSLNIENIQLKPNIDIVSSVTDKSSIELSQKTSCCLKTNDNLAILSIDDLIELVSLVTNKTKIDKIKKTLYPLVKTTFEKCKTKRIRPNFMLGVITRTILQREWAYFDEIIPAMNKTSFEMIDYIFDQWMSKIDGTGNNQKLLVSRGTLSRYMQKLTELHWVIRVGKGESTRYWINPFLRALGDLVKDSIKLCDYAIFGLDFFDVMNLPLLNILKSRKIVDDVSLSFFSFRKDGTFKMMVKEWYRGALLVNFIFNDKTEKLVILPVNLHGQHVYNGIDKNGKKRYRLYEHNCIPIKWEIFGFSKTCYFSKQGKTERVNIHFDKSFSLIVDKNSYGKTTAYYKNWIKQWEHSAKKFDGYEYLEFNDFDLIEDLFKARFVKKKSGQELINHLGLKLASKGGRGHKKEK